MTINPSSTLKESLSLLPEKAGVYQYFDAKGCLLYVGKAKNLKKRVSSYFNKEQNRKVAALVKKISDIRYVVVPTEFDALLLENNLIKEYQPHYNILLKDDKTYPWLCITKENFPRLFATRKKIKDGSLYFGPYPSVKMMHTLLDLISDLYSLRICRHPLSLENISKKRYKACLQYHIKKCQAPCIEEQSQEEYQAQFSQIKELLRGHISPILQSLHKKMQEAAEMRDFKGAQLLKEKIELLRKYQSKSAVVSSNIADADVLQLYNEADLSYIHYMKIVEGGLVWAQTIEAQNKLQQSEEEVLDNMLPSLREYFQCLSSELILPFLPSYSVPDIRISVPKMGDKKQLLDLALQNIRFHVLERQKRQEKLDPERHSMRILELLKKDLGMTEMPKHIECFDNSNFQGDYPVAAMTVFKDAKASKKDYRHFHIKTVEGANDFASMEEVVYRRYKRVLEEDQKLPQLIVVDGGKGQLSSAYKSLQKLGIESTIFLIGIAEKLEEIYKVGDPHPLLLDKKSESLKLIQQIRDEAHRFGITHYRKKHEKGLIKTELTEIQGIGNETALTLLQCFHSVKNIRQTDLETLAKEIGLAKAKIVKNFFKD